MDIARDPVEAAPAPRPTRFSWAAHNPLVRAVGRVRLPLGAKLIVGFAAIATLLAVGYALGLVALSQSNSRGAQLRTLQQREGYVELLLTDARQLGSTVDYRINAPRSGAGFAPALEQVITIQVNQLCVDAGSANCFGRSKEALTLGQVDPSLFTALSASLSATGVLARLVPEFVGNFRPLTPASLRSADRFMASLTDKLTALEQRTRARANALVAGDRSSFSSSRILLIGVGAGSLVLALGLGLLLSLSVVAPLRHTEERLAEIGAGDFTGRLDVPNRDEIGTLAQRVNQTSDELQRVYRELETASRHKSDFLATMSHELRTPLNAIIGFSEVLHEQMFGELNERQLSYVNDVLAAGRHLLSLINDVLDLAKIEAGRMELELSEVTLPELLRNAISMNSERASRGGVELALTTEPAEITVTADERRVRQIVFNLLSNAIKFTPPDGRVDISAQLNDGQAEIAVADTGPGIAGEDLEVIFGEFEQTSEGRKAEGTGLGLPLSRKLVELHGGRLWVDSQPGKGSTFRFTLPVRQEA